MYLCMVSVSFSQMERHCLRLPLRERLKIIHGLAILPRWCGDTAIVDDDLNSTSQEVCSLLDLLANLINGPKVADGGTELFLVVVLLEMYGGRVLQLFLINVKDKDFVPALEESAHDASANATSTAADDGCLRDCWVGIV